MNTGDAIEIGRHAFAVVEQLGSGRIANVFLVRSSGGVERVLKALRDPERAAIDPAAFLAEADVLERLRAIDAQRGRVGRDAHFPAVHLRDAERCLFVMDRAPGRSLADVVGRTVLSVEQCLSVAIQLCEALEVAIEAGVCNTDLKLDSVIWDPRDDRLMVIDWNVHQPWPPPQRPGWLDPYAAMVAEVLDRLLLDLYGEHRDEAPDWSRPPRRMPRRWSDYLRVFQLLFTAICAAPEQWSVAEIDRRLRRIEAALGGEPEALLLEVVTGLVAARDERADRVARLEEALAFAELAANVRNPNVIFRARELIGQAVDLLGPDAESIETLREAVRGEGREIHVPPGDAIELHRLKRMAHAGHAVLGAVDDLRRVAHGYEHLRWQTASNVLDELLRRFAGQETLVEELTPLADEAAGLVRCTAGLKCLHDGTSLRVPDGTMHGFDPNALHALEQQKAQLFERAADHLEAGLERLRRVPWFEALRARFPEIESVAGEVRLEAAAARDAMASYAERQSHRSTSLPTRTDGLDAVAAVSSPPASSTEPAAPTSTAASPAPDAAPGPTPIDDAAPETPSTPALDDDEPFTPPRHGGLGLLLLAGAVALVVVLWSVWPDDGAGLAAVDAEPESVRIRIGSGLPGADARAALDAAAPAPPVVDAVVDADEPDGAEVPGAGPDTSLPDAEPPPPDVGRRRPPRRPVGRRPADAAPVAVRPPPRPDAARPSPPSDAGRPKSPPQQEEFPW